MEINTKELKSLLEFFQWKKENPEKYIEFLKDLKEFYKDMQKVLQEI